jgi:hypothetical protein
MSGASEVPETAQQPAQANVDPFEHEQRFVLTRAQVIAFYSAIGPRAALELYDKVRPISYTRTTYLDTDDFAYFRSCEGPVARRVRVREYAVASSLADTPVLSGISYLELKQNAGTSRSKVRISAPPAVLRGILQGGAQGDDVAAEVAQLEPLAALRAIQEELATGTLAPRLTTWYRRTCMTGEGGRVRITLDENLTFCRAQPLGDAGEAVGATDAFATGPARILEVKHWGETPEWLSRAVEGLSAAPNFSKFRMGMLALQQKGEAPELPVARTRTPAPTLFVLGGPAA